MPAKLSLEHGHRPCSSQCSRVSVENPGPDLSVGGWLTCFLCKPGRQVGEILSLWLEFHVRKRCKVREFFLWARPAKSMRWLIIASAGFRPRGRNPRSTSNVPRVKRKHCIVVLLECENFLDLMKPGGHGGPGQFSACASGSAAAQTGLGNESHSPNCVRISFQAIRWVFLPLSIF